MVQERDCMRLENYCMLSTDDLMTMLSNSGGAKDHGDYVFFDRGSKVLLVAHADVSPSIERCRFFSQTDIHMPGYKDIRVFSPYLDDRLGVWTVLEYLPAMGIYCDVLITTGEEVGNSSASDFAVDYFDKEYNWIVEFDRRGEDVVTYQYKSKKMAKALKRQGFRIGQGSFSDICELDEFGCACFNVGLGYHREHSTECWASLAEFRRQMKKFTAFYWENRQKTFPYHMPRRDYMQFDSILDDIDEGYLRSLMYGDKLRVGL